MREPDRSVVFSNHDDADLKSPGFSRIEEVAGIGYWEDDLVQGVSWWSDGLYRLFGLEPDEWPATVQTLEGIIPPSDLARIERARKKALISGLQIDLEHRVVHQDASVCWLRLAARTELDDSGRPLRLYGTCVDITEYKKVERRLYQFKKMETLGQFAGCVVHDLNNQLCGIVGNADILVNELEKSRHRDCAEIIVNAASNCTDLTRPLLDIGRQGPPPPTSIDIHDTITEIVALLTHSLDERIEVRTDFNARAGMIIGDSAEIQNALLNLALNARDAMPDGGVLEFRTDLIDLDDHACSQGAFEIEPGPYLRISVVDTGIGMDIQTRQRAFEPFFTTKGPGIGSGLGLASVQRAVESHDGATRLVTAPGMGTRVDLFLPVGK